MTEKEILENASLRKFLFNIAFQISQDTEDAEDIVQETYFQYLLYKDKIKITNIKGLLRFICKREASRWCAARNKRVQGDKREFKSSFNYSKVCYNDGEVNYDIKAYKEQLITLQKRKEAYKSGISERVLGISFHKLKVKRLNKERTSQTYEYYIFRKKGSS